MTRSPDFEDRLAGRLERTAATVAGDAVDLPEVLEHHARVTARRRRRRQAAAGGALVLLLAVGGTWALRDDGPTRLDAADPSGSTTITTDTTTSTTSTSTSTTTSTTVATTTTVTPPPPPDWPAARPTLTHGGEAWGVYLAVDPEFDAPVLAESRRQVEALGVGYSTGPGELGCDQGAAEALGLDPDAFLYATALYFWSEVDAQRFVDLYEPEVVGIALVETYCMD